MLLPCDNYFHPQFHFKKIIFLPPALAQVVELVDTLL